jgi:uncharacterized protein involved in type VI secretion and phage assembly
MTGAQQMQGVVIGIVRQIDAQRACIKAEFPWMQGQLSHWAPVATLMSGKKRGVYYLPEKDDEVLIAFDQGKFDHPYVVGFLWNGADVPPAADEHTRTIHSVNGHEITIYDPPGSQDDKGFVRVKDAHGNAVELAKKGVTITGNDTIRIELQSPNGTIQVEAPTGTIQIQAPAVTINGRLVAPTGPTI